MISRICFAVKLVIAILLAMNTSARGADVLENERLRVEFGPEGLSTITDKSADSAKVAVSGDAFTVAVNDFTFDSHPIAPTARSASPTTQTYIFASNGWSLRVVYELQPGWSFISKRLVLVPSGNDAVHIKRLEPFRATITGNISEDQPVRGAAFIRFKGDDRRGLLLAIQNPFLQWKRDGNRVSLAYEPDMDWQPADGAFESDRVLIAPYTRNGHTVPIKMVPEWRYVREEPHDEGPWLDWAEIDALTGVARAFVMHPPTKSLRLNVGWCENDYQIDIAKPEGRAEYKRIIDQAAALSCKHVLFAPANSDVSSLSDSRDAWGWENILWLGMGQQLRQGKWKPQAGKLPPNDIEMIDYAKGKDIRFLAYVYPSLPFLQDPQWTAWVKRQGKEPGGYMGADTGIRSFQDWLLNNLVTFHNRFGVSGYSFDHWFIAYDGASSKYAQWYGCRRVLEELRRQVPDVVIDGRQQYQHFGVWTWLAGSYPHPTSTDEQPQSFVAFPDLHIDRVSADRQRWAAWWYRVNNFCPPELMPGFITHQTPRNDAKGEMPRTSFRARDWDYLGWRYSLLSSIATAPMNHVVNMIPARDEEEFRHFSDADKEWFRSWLDWTDTNIDVLRNIRPILGQPMLGRVDGSAAFKGGRGFIFLFNPNYRAMNAQFKLDDSIGLREGKRFLLKQLYPDAEKGKLLVGGTADGFFARGDTVSLPLAGTDALAVEVTPAPESLDQPLLLGAPGKIALSDRIVELTDIRGEAGTSRPIRIVMPRALPGAKVRLNGHDWEFLRTGAGRTIDLTVRFAGAPFSQAQQIGRYESTFAGGDYSASISIPKRVFQQLARRKQSWPIPYTADDLEATWLGPDRLLLFVNIAEPKEAMDVTLKIDGKPVELRKAYSSIYRSAPERTFVGWYADVSSLEPDAKHEFSVSLPKLEPGQFQGLFFDNIEPEYTDRLASNVP